MKLRKYRIVTDAWLGYEAQVWRIWWSFWTPWFNGQMTNTFTSIEKAEQFIKSQRVVKYVEAP